MRAVLHGQRARRATGASGPLRKPFPLGVESITMSHQSAESGDSDMAVIPRI